MAVWKRGRISRRLGLVFWTVVFLIFYFRYPFSPSHLLNPATSKNAAPGVASSKQTTGWSARIKLPGALPRPGDPSSAVRYFIKSSYDWSKLSRRYPIDEADMVRPPKGPPKPLGRVQHNFHRATATLDPKQQAQREAVRNAFKRCWDSYMEYAFPKDELAPVSLEGKDTFGGWAATMVDALDTLWIMGLHNEFYSILPAVGALDWNDTPLTSVNVFETTIRYLGGLLSAYDLSGEDVLLRKAVELGEMLYAAFDTPNHMPPFWLEFGAAKAGTQRAGSRDPSASPCSLSLELTRLSQLTSDPKYYDAIDRITRFLERTQNSTMLPGMWPTMMDFASLSASGSDFSLGGEADSLYEYFPKMSALLGGRDASYEKMYRASMNAADKHLVFRPMVPGNEDILFVGDVRVRAKDDVQLIADGQHLSCFVGGMFALGGKLYGIDAHVETGEKIARGCAWAYAQFPTGVMPEIFGLIPCASRTECKWDEEKWESDGNQGLPKGFRHARDPRYILRPEAIESIFLLYRMTGKPEYRDIAWRMFLAIQSTTATKEANSAIADVTVKPDDVHLLDSMESFWLAETLKYFYLIFSTPDTISLDEYVFNTEAHPFKRPDR
ncbi:glycoside hydrolase [Echria macrotheca]|uniref:alpha-1,2-Mannosidase n=1 Tax=Echria macrotheca TaxID=438768 RepID=A0AAJ0BPM6_9PEZI|nr:glycoside hydrolase [Echria macrotheca]